MKYVAEDNGLVAIADLATAEKVIADMQGGSLFDVSPGRSRRIIAEAIATEREACASEVSAIHAELRAMGGSIAAERALKSALARIRARGSK